MDESRLELKVGVLVLAALAGTLGLLWLMGEVSFGSGNVVTVNFTHTGNVVKGAPVKLGGVVVGKVDDIKLVPGRIDQKSGQSLPVQMTVSISREAIDALRADAAVTVSTQGPLGEPYLEMWSGVSQQPYDRKGEIRGVDAPRLDIVSNKLARFLEVASDLLEKDPDSLNKLLKGVGGLSETMDGVLTENREDLRTLVADLTQAAKDLKTVAALAKGQLEPGGKAHGAIDDAAVAAKVARENLPGLAKKANTALDGFNNVAGQLTPEDGAKVKDALARLDAVAVRADKLLAKLEAGEGTAGAMMKDKQVYEDLKTLLADLRKHPWKLLWKD